MLLLTLKSHIGTLHSEIDALQHGLFTATCRYLSSARTVQTESNQTCLNCRAQPVLATYQVAKLAIILHKKKKTGKN